ncbi:excinuclease ABC subunit UvrC [bacterium]|nr:excinuclease ABC subunit UvrC [bacterium]
MEALAMNDDIDALKELVSEFPVTPGVYLMHDQNDNIIYVGKAKNLKSRVRSYLNQSKDHTLKTKFLISKIQHIKYILTKTEVEAFLLEASLIKKHKPRYNIRLKDDKTYPYIRCNKTHKFPHFQLSRKVKLDGALYFGPYTSSLVVKDTILFINKNFLIRDCKDSTFKSRTRPCLTYQIKRCKAPCVDYVSQEEYAEDLKKSLNFIRGKSKNLLKELKTKMKEASDDERYEAAAKYRDSIDSVKALWEKQSVVSSSDLDDKDVFYCKGGPHGTLVELLNIRGGRVIGNRSHFLSQINLEEDEEKEWFTSFLNQYYSDNKVPSIIIVPFDLGRDIFKLLQDVLVQRQNISPQFNFVMKENNPLMSMASRNAENHYDAYVVKKKTKSDALVEIQQKLKLPELPTRIECYDISNFQGDQTVASQVVAEDGMLKKEDYRKYKIKSVKGPDDYASMKEVLMRRFKHTEYESPQLIVVDGGKGQLSIAVEVLKELNLSQIPVVGLAKARAKRRLKDKVVEKTEERFYLPGRQNPVVFREGSEPFKILVGLRDEAHRFAIGFQRKLQKTKSLSSVFDDIKGLGPAKKKLLLTTFETISDIKKASVEELCQLKGITEDLAKKVKSSI